MKTIVAVLIAFSVLTVIAGRASAAWEPQQFWEEQQSQGLGG
jgi:hypothetical protein